MSHPNQCLNCGYAVGQTGSRTCPECGVIVHESFVEAVEARRVMDAGRARELKRHVGAWAVIVVVFALGAGLVGSSLAPIVVALLLLGACLMVSMATGGLVVLLSPAWHRRYVMAAWIRAMWWIHAPWLGVGIGSGVIIMAAFVDHAMGWHPNLVVWTGVAALPIWMLLCFVALFRAFEMCFDSLGRWWPPASCPARRDLVGACLGVGIFTTMALAFLVGVVGASFVVSIAAS